MLRDPPRILWGEYGFCLRNSEFLNKIPQPAVNKRRLWPSQVSGLGSMFSYLQSCFFAEIFGLQSFGPADLPGARLRSPRCLQWQFHRHHEHSQAPPGPGKRGSWGASGKRKRRASTPARQNRACWGPRCTDAGGAFPDGQGKPLSSFIPQESHTFFGTSKRGVTCSWGDPFLI
jgi:hypothetical protein